MPRPGPVSPRRRAVKSQVSAKTVLALISLRPGLRALLTASTSTVTRQAFPGFLHNAVNPH